MQTVDLPADYEVPVFPTRTPRYPFDQAIARIANFFDLNAQQLQRYAEEDTLGGYHHDIRERTHTKGIWGVEGQILYALIRLSQPRHVLEIGNAWGCSTHHIGEAIIANGKGKVTSLDLNNKVVRYEEFMPFMKTVKGDLLEFNYRTRPRLDFIFEDSYHRPELVSHVWREFMEWAKPGAFIISHDSEHFRVGESVHEGIRQVISEGEYLSLAIDPADCGLAIWRKP